MEVFLWTNKMFSYNLCTMSLPLLLCVHICLSVDKPNEKDTTTNVACIFIGLSSTLISSVALRIYPCPCFFLLIHDTHSVSLSLPSPVSHCPRLLPELAEGPDSSPTGWRCSDWMQAQDVSSGCHFLEEGEGSLEGELQVRRFFVQSSMPSVYRTVV